MATIRNRCLGLLGFTQQEQAWEDSSATGCRVYYKNLVSTLPDGSPGLNPSGLERAQLDFDVVFAEMLRNQGGELLFVPRPLQLSLHAACLDNPGMCEETLTEYCGPFSRDEVAQTPQLTRWCGCYYGQGTPTEFERECDSTCSRLDTIPLREEAQVSSKRCTSNVCVLDNITVEVSDGEINFTQSCGDCSSVSKCRCFISNLAVMAMGSTSKVQAKNSCGGNSVCTSEGVITPCSSFFEQVSDDQDSETETTSRSFLVLIVALILFVIILFVVIMLFIKKRRGS